MIRLTIQDNTERKSVIVDENTSVATVLEEAGFGGTTRAVNLCGYTVTDLSKTLKELDAPETAWISLVKQEKNA